MPSTALHGRRCGSARARFPCPLPPPSGGCRAGRKGSGQPHRAGHAQQQRAHGQFRLGAPWQAEAPGQPHRAGHAQQQRAHGQPAAEAVHGQHAAVQERLQGKALQQAALAAKAVQQQAEALPAVLHAQYEGIQDQAGPLNQAEAT